MSVVYNLLERKLRLYIKKVSLMGKVFAEKPRYIWNYKDINSLQSIITREIALNKKLLRYMKLYAESKSHAIDPMAVKFEGLTRNLIIVLRNEKRVLKEIGIGGLLLYELRVLLLHRSRGYFEIQFAKFSRLHKYEQHLDAQMFLIVSSEKKGLAMAKIKVYNKLAKDIQVSSKKLLGSVGNNALVRKNAIELLKLIDKVQSTELYAYINSDLLFIKNKIKEIIRNPNQSKVKTLLAAIYLFAPGTFETTAYILLIKNLTKITVKKIHKNKKRFSKPRVS